MWCTDEVLELAIKRERLHHIARRSKDENKRKEAHQSRNALKNLIANSKKEFFKGYFETYSHDLKKFWKRVNELLGGKESEIKQMQVTDLDTGQLGDVNRTADIINKFF